MFKGALFEEHPFGLIFKIKLKNPVKRHYILKKKQVLSKKIGPVLSGARNRT